VEPPRTRRTQRLKAAADEVPARRDLIRVRSSAATSDLLSPISFHCSLSTRHYPLDASSLHYITALYILSDSRAMRECGILFGFGPNPVPDKDLKNFPGHLRHSATWPLFLPGGGAGAATWHGHHGRVSSGAVSPRISPRTRMQRTNPRKVVVVRLYPRKAVLSAVHCFDARTRYCDLRSGPRSGSGKAGL
jgi:hypothetical protein